jgi:hypothetical protein
LADLDQIRETVNGNWDRYAAGKLDLAAAAVTTNMALMLARQLEDDARVDLVKIFGNMDASRQAAVQQLAKTLKITVAIANSIMQGNIYLPLYSQILKGPKGQSTTEDYQLEDKIFFHTFQAMSDWHTGCLLRGVRKNRLSTQEGVHGSHAYPGLWEGVSIENKKRCHRASVMETLTELHFLGSLKDKAPVQDHLSRGVFSAVEEKTLHLSTTFGVHLLFTIHRKLKDAGLSEHPVRSLTQFLSAATSKMSGVSAVFHAQNSRGMIEPTCQHIKELQGDIFKKLKVATKAGVISTTPFFTLLRHPFLCGLILHSERVLVQNTALALEKNLGAINAAVHLGNAFIQEGYIQTLGSLQFTAHIQGDKRCFLGGKRPTTKEKYLEAYGLAVGWSMANLAPTSRGGSLAARKNKLELAAPAPFSRATERQLRDPLGRVSLTEAGLIEMLRAASPRLEQVYSSARAGAGALPSPSPLQHAALLLHAEGPMLGHDYLSSMEVAWRALQAVYGVMNRDKSLTSAEQAAGIALGAHTIGNEPRFKTMAGAYAAKIAAVNKS